MLLVLLYVLTRPSHTPLPSPFPCCVAGDRYDPEPRTRRAYKEDFSGRSHEEGGGEGSTSREYRDEQSGGGGSQGVRVYRDEQEPKEDTAYHDDTTEKKDSQWR